MDATGEPVRLQQPAARIVSLAPHVTELLFAAGAGDRLVGAVQYSDYPAAARQIPRIGNAHRLDLERIAALQPDLVIGWRSGNPAGQLQQIRQLGLPLYITEPDSLDGIAATIEQLGRLAGTGTTASSAARDFRRHLSRLQAEYSDRKPVGVFYEVWPEPLITISGDHVISKVIRLCGGRNIFAGMQQLAPRVSLEAVLAAAPQVIITSGSDEQRPAWLDEWRQWSQLPAVRHEQLHFIPPGLLQRPTPRILTGAERLCEILVRARTAIQSGQ